MGPARQQPGGAFLHFGAEFPKWVPMPVGHLFQLRPTQNRSMIVLLSEWEEDVRAEKMLEALAEVRRAAEHRGWTTAAYLAGITALAVDEAAGEENSTQETERSRPNGASLHTLSR